MIALKRGKFVISWRNTKVVISLSTRVPERIVGNGSYPDTGFWEVRVLLPAQTP